MKYLITGGSGQVGYDVMRELLAKDKSAEILIPTHEDMDITKREETIFYIRNFMPDVIFHCAAYTNVDGAETEMRMAYDINVNGTANITEAARCCDAKLIYVSTDYVFDGSKKGLYEMTDEARPINVYGKTKLLGEEIVRDYQKHFIARTSWVFGVSGNGNFVKTMLRLVETHDRLRVVSDQVGSPTYSKDLAKLLIEMSESEEYGTYPANNEGYTTWKEFAEAIFEEYEKDVIVEGITTEAYNAKAPRPLNTCLSKSSLDESGFKRLPHWRDALKSYKVDFEEYVSRKEKQRNLRKES